MNPDLGILLFIREHLVNDFLTSLVVPFTIYGIYLYFFVSILFLFKKETRALGIVLLTSLILVEILDNSVKLIVMRERPYESTAVKALVAAPFGSSFPSVHAGLSFAFLTAYYLKTKETELYKYRWFVLIYCTLMALTRLYVFVHYPSDILVGALSGILCGYIALYLYKLIKEKA